MVESTKRSSKLHVDDKLIMDMKPEELHELESVFKSIDKDGDGHIDCTELLNVFHCLGYREMKEKDVMAIIKEVDTNNNQKIEYPEYIMMMHKFQKLGIKEKFTKIINKQGQTQFKVEGTGSYSTFSEEERTAYTKVINTVLAKDPDCSKFLPLNPDEMEIFSALKNGVILCKLINCACPGTIDERVINKKDNMNVFLCMENLKLALSAAKAIGIRVIGIDHTIFLEQKYNLILGVLWQAIKMVLLASISLKKHPQLIRLLKDGEEIADLLKLPPEEILKRWFNYHLDKAKYEKKLNNFSSDLKDSEKYTILLNQLDNKRCDKSALQETDLIKRGKKVLENAKKLGAESFITPEDIQNGNEKLNLLFTAEIFNNFHGLEDLNEKELYDAAKLLNDDVEGTREERAFRMWINSLGLDDVYVNNLYEDCRSGVLLLKVMDKIKPNTVNWKKVDLHATNKFAKVVNCNEAIDSAKRLHLSIVGIAGPDIHEPNKKLVLAVVWQLMRESTLQILGNKTENDLISWANGLVTLDPPLKNFGDKRLHTGIFFIDLMAVIEPRAIDWEIVKKDDESPEALENNTKYALSIARKLGATIFLVWEDITEVKPKMLMTFVAGLYEVWLLESQLKKEKKNIKDSELSTNVGLDH